MLSVCMSLDSLEVVDEESTQGGPRVNDVLREGV